MLQLEAEFDAACREVAALPPEKRAGTASRRGATGRSSSIMSMASRRSSMQPHEQTQQMVSFGSSLLLDHVIALYKLRQHIRSGRLQQRRDLQQTCRAVTVHAWWRARPLMTLSSNHTGSAGAAAAGGGGARESLHSHPDHHGSLPDCATGGVHSPGATAAPLHARCGSSC